MSATRILPFALLFLTVCLSAQPPKLVVPAGHTGSVSQLRIRKDGKYFISISDQVFGDNTLKGWDQKTGKLLYSIEKKNPVTFNSDGTCFASLVDLSTCEVRSAHSGEELYRIRAINEEFNSVLFSPSSPVLATLSLSLTSPETYLCVWSHPGGKLLRRQVIGRGGTGLYFYQPVLQFSPNGKLLFTACMLDSLVKIWEPLTGKLVKELIIPDVTASDLVFHPAGTKLLQHRRMNEDNLVWDLQTGKPVLQFKTAFDPTLAVSFSEHGQYILTRSFTHKENNRIYDALTAEDLTEKAAQPNSDIWYNGFTLAQNEKYLLVNDSSRVTKAIDLKTGTTLFYLRDSFNRRPVPQEKIYFSPDGKYIITKSFASVVKVWNGSTGIFLFRLGTDLYKPSRELELSDDGQYLVEKNDGAAVTIWDYRKGKLVRYYSLRGHVKELIAADISYDGTLFLSSSSDQQIRLWDAATGKTLLSFIAHKDRINSVRFSPDGSRFISSSSDNMVCLWDTKTGKLLRAYRHPSYVLDAVFSPDAKHILSICGDFRARTWSTIHGDPEAVFTGHTDYLLSANYSPDGKRIVTTSNDKSVRIWDANGRLLFTQILNGAGAINASYRPDGKQLLVNEYNGYSLWETGDDTTVRSMRSFGPYTNVELSYQYGPGGEAILWVNDTVSIVDYQTGLITRHRFPEGKYKMRFSKSGNNFISTFNGELRVHDSRDFTLRNRLIAIDSSDWFNHVPAGYYQGTQGAVKWLHYVSRDLKIIAFGQLDARYNRPDKVLEAIGNTDTVLISSYRKAWEKRIRKLGIDTTAFKDGYSVPECDFVNRDNIAYEQVNGELRLRIKGMDSSYQLDRFNVWVNETPLFGLRGISLRKKRSNRLDTLIRIQLSQGENLVEASVTNVNGTESYRIPLHINYTPAVRQKETTRFIGIGIDQFANKDYNLQYSSKDIRDLAVKLKEKYKEDIIIDTLFNEKVTVANIKALKQKLQQGSVNDKVIISYSGHGLLSKEYDYYLSTYSINFDKPEEKGLAYEELENLLDSIPARKKLMLIDACHSGEVDKEEMTRITASEDSLKKQGTKGGKPRFTGKTQVGMKNSFELMQSLFVNVGKSTGATIISAAAGTQFALERGDLKNGVFTYCLLEAMEKNPNLKISELKRIVGERVEQLTNGLQKPTSRNETIAVDWSL